MNFCLHCEVWGDDATCWSCGRPTTQTPRTHPARSWRNPATWDPTSGLWSDDE